MNLLRRVHQLECRSIPAPEACMVYVDGEYTVVIDATGERLPREEYARRYPHHPTLKCYLGWRMVELFEDQERAPC